MTTPGSSFTPTPLSHEDNLEDNPFPMHTCISKYCGVLSSDITQATYDPTNLREQPLNSHPSQISKLLLRRDEEPRSRLPDPIDQPITVMALSRMKKLHSHPTSQTILIRD
ncbi:hypothetical protein TNCV_280181 [Trichonephila clavipes]|nr:hypothetical protein TNCV_280181 [Trichonephila clavipes]